MNTIRFKWDGHTHTSLCPHGKKEPTELMIERAIEKGFTHYSITEHAPLPKNLIKNKKLHNELCLAPNQLDEYFEHAKKLKKKYQGKIKILVGLEFDYIPSLESFTKELLEACSPFLDDSILSLHLLPGVDGLRVIDYTPEEIEEGLLTFYGSYTKYVDAYWDWILKMVNYDFGKFQPKRIGHIDLVGKFKNYFSGSKYPEGKVSRVFEQLKRREFSIDFNQNGLSCSRRLESYVNDELLDYVADYQIPVVYGSDAHGIEKVGQFYDDFEKRSLNLKMLQPA